MYGGSPPLVATCTIKSWFHATATQHHLSHPRSNLLHFRLIVTIDSALNKLLVAGHELIVIHLGPMLRIGSFGPGCRRLGTLH